MKKSRIIVLLIALLAMNACGKQGPLKLPEKAPKQESHMPTEIL